MRVFSLSTGAVVLDLGRVEVLFVHNAPVAAKDRKEKTCYIAINEGGKQAVPDVKEFLGSESFRLRDTTRIEVEDRIKASLAPSNGKPPTPTVGCLAPPGGARAWIPGAAFRHMWEHAENMERLGFHAPDAVQSQRYGPSGEGYLVDADPGLVCWLRGAGRGLVDPELSRKDRKEVARALKIAADRIELAIIQPN